MSVDCYVVRGFGGKIVQYVATPWSCFNRVFERGEVYPVRATLEMVDKCTEADDEAKKVIEKLIEGDNPPEVIGIWPQYDCE